MTEQELERERCIDDDYEVVNNYYRAKYWHPNIPFFLQDENGDCLLYTSPSPRDYAASRMPSSA